MEAMISGKPKGWYDYKEIEWIEFPKDIVLIFDHLGSIGQFEVERSQAGLRLFAYK
jgi:hypothetical protein